MRQTRFWMIIGLILVGTLLLTACGGGNEETPAPETEATAVPDAPPPTEPPPPTNTPIPPTNTPVPPTATPEPTNTPEPTATPEPAVSLASFTSEEGGFTIEYPDSWFTQDLFGLSMFASNEELMDSPDDGEEGAIAVVFAAGTDEMGSEDPEEILSLFVEEFDLGDADVIDGPTATTINGQDGALVVLSTTADDSDTPLTAWAFSIVNEGRAGVLIGITPSETAAEFGPTFQAMVETLDISAGAVAGGGDKVIIDPPVTDGDEIRQWASTATASSEYTDSAWSAQQATGAPDTTECGDIDTAWASSESNGVDTLEVFFNLPVYATEFNIHQTFNPDQVVLVEALGVDGEVNTLYSGEPSAISDPCPYVLNVSGEGEQTSFPVYGLRITVDQSVLGTGWNEIDAVELVGVPATGASVPVTPSDGGDLNVAFVQDESELAFVFFIDNSDNDMAIENSEYEAVYYDASGAMIDSEIGYIELIMPGTVSVIADSSYLDDGVEVASLEVTLTYGDETTAAYPSDFLSVSVPNYYPDDFFSVSTGLVSNSLEQMVTDVRVNAVAYDAAGNIVGSGFTFVDFIPGGSETGVSVYMTIAEGAEVDSVSLSPMMTSLSDVSAASDQGLNIVDIGFSQDSFELGYGFILENRSDTTLTFSTYQITAFDAAGNVVEAQSSFVNTVFGGETMAIGDSIFLPEGVEVDGILIQVLDGWQEDHEVLSENPFAVENAAFVPDDFFPQVTGTLINAYTSQASDVIVYAVLYDADGNIVGGGFTFVDAVPGGGSADFEAGVGVDPGIEVASVQVYATVSSLTDFGE